MATSFKKAVKISQKNLLGIQDLSVSDVKLILSEAQKFIKLNRSKTVRIKPNIENGLTATKIRFKLPMEPNFDKKCRVAIPAINGTTTYKTTDMIIALRISFVCVAPIKIPSN